MLGSIITCAVLAIFMKCFLYIFRFEIEIEPIFGTLALYDVKEKKKVFFSSSLIRWRLFCYTTYVMLRSCLTNSISLVSKGFSGSAA